MQLKNLIKNNKVISISLVIISMLLVYFVGFNSSMDFASTRVLEAKLDPAQLEEVEQKVKENSSPIRVMQSEDGLIKFYYQNLSNENATKVSDILVKDFEAADIKDYEAFPVLDTNIQFRYTNIFVFSLIGLIVTMFLLFRLGLSAVQLFKIIVSMGLAILFELIVAIGLLSLFGLVGVQISYLTTLPILFLIVISICIKFFAIRGVQDRIIKGAVSIKESWQDFAQSKRKFFMDLGIIAIIAVVPAAIIKEEIRIVLIELVVVLVIVLYSSIYLVPEFLGIQLINKSGTKKNANSRSKKRKSK